MVKKISCDDLEWAEMKSQPAQDDADDICEALASLQGLGPQSWCVVCDKRRCPGERCLQCAGCIAFNGKKRFYCSRHCQKVDWARGHRQFCQGAGRLVDLDLA